MGFRNIRAYVDAELEGRYSISTFRKNVAAATTGTVWYDLAYAPGNPSPNYYASSPLIGEPLSHSGNGGLYVGKAVTPYQKYLKRLSVGVIGSSAIAPITFKLCDYLFYYPFCDDSTLDEQTLDNSQSLTRYTDGLGVQVIAINQASRTGGQTFQFTYTNSDGVSGRVSQVVTQNSVATVGTVLNAQNTNLANTSGPFIALQRDDQGVRSIQSVQMVSGTDVGLFALVLVKPIADICLTSVTGFTEIDYLQMTSTVPEIKDDAFLGMLCLPTVNIAGVNILGEISTVWN